MKTLTATHIKLLVYPVSSMSTVYTALRDLKTKNLIGYQSYGKGRGIGNLDRLYYLTQKGFNHLKSSRIVKNLEQKFRRYEKPFVDSYYDHRLKLLNFWVSLYTELRKESIYDLKTFVPEWDKINGNSIVLRSQFSPDSEFTLQPDATFILLNIQFWREVLFFVEIDTGTESLSSNSYPCIVERFEKYQKAFKEGAFKNIDPTFQRFFGARLLFITSSQKRIENLFNILNIEEDLKDAFLFATHSEIASNGVTGGRYLKQGYNGIVGINSKGINQ